MRVIKIYIIGYFNGAAVYKPRRASTVTDGLYTTSNFNGAAVYKPRRAELEEAQRERAMTSMGPRFINRGEMIAIQKEIIRTCTSMGPRVINRGEYNMTPKIAVDFSTSMGPRFINRGETRAGNRRRRRQKLLQWGRGL